MNMILAEHVATASESIGKSKRDCVLHTQRSRILVLSIWSLLQPIFLAAICILHGKRVLVQGSRANSSLEKPFMKCTRVLVS